MDAVPFVIATKGPRVAKPAEQYAMLRTFREFLQWREGDAIILAEANVPGATTPRCSCTISTASLAR
jgi:maltose alpha-D-glucosyltransferase / alpha-amylase